MSAHPNALGLLDRAKRIIDESSPPDHSLLTTASRDIREARAAIAEPIEAAKSVEPRDCYMDEHDEVGTFGCCGEVTYHPHAADCWLSRLNAAIARVSGGAK